MNTDLKALLVGIPITIIITIVITFIINHIDKWFWVVVSIGLLAVAYSIGMTILD